MVTEYFTVRKLEQNGMNGLSSLVSKLENTSGITSAVILYESTNRNLPQGIISVIGNYDSQSVQSFLKRNGFDILNESEVQL